MVVGIARHPRSVGRRFGIAGDCRHPNTKKQRKSQSWSLLGGKGAYVIRSCGTVRTHTVLPNGARAGGYLDGRGTPNGGSKRRRTVCERVRRSVVARSDRRWASATVKRTEIVSVYAAAAFVFFICFEYLGDHGDEAHGGRSGRGQRPSRVPKVPKVHVGYT